MILFALPAPPHEILAYSYLRLLSWTLQALWLRSRDTLSDLKESFVLDRVTLGYLEESEMDACVGPLEKALRKPVHDPCGRRSFADYSGGDGAAALSKWRDAVQRSVAAVARGEAVLTGAYLSGELFDPLRHRKKVRK